ncbi:MAG TPA: ABC transporter permease, partial [Flavisolibacter sp.]|nr:ABC transporter permease [Flavisolibacter sp.]
MLKNYIKVAWRSISRNWFHSSLNLFGLSIGLAFTLLISAYAWKETRVNKELRNHSNQYIIQSKWTDPTMGMELTTVGPMAKNLREQYPTLVKNYYRWDGVTSNVSKGDKVFREGLQIGDSTLLNMFGFRLLDGDPRTALNEPFSLVIREDRALKYFGKKEVVGETLTIQSFSGSRHDFRITGVMATPEENSVTFLNRENDNAFFIPESSIDYFGRTLDNWQNAYIVNYVELQPGVKPVALLKPMQDLLNKNAPEPIAANMHPNLAPLNQYYLAKDNGLVRKMLFTVSIIALFILLMAVINFVNVSISKSATRIREIGVRKVMGGQRKQLLFQFLLESVVLVGLATILALGFYVVARPFLSDILGKSITPLGQLPLWFFPALLIFGLLIGLAAGLYPALVLSGMKAVDSIKGKFKSIKDNSVLRKTLVGFQFFTAAVVLTGALIVTKQVALFFSRDLGYDKEYVLAAQVPRDWTSKGVQHMQAIRNEFATLPQVAQVSLSWQIPNGWENGNQTVYKEGQDSAHARMIENMVADENYAGAYKIPIIAGRFFEQTSDTSNTIINEKAVAALGWKQASDAIGQRVYLPGNFPLTVIGVVKDFQGGSMKNQIQPALFTHVALSNTYRYLSFKLKPGNIGTSIEAIQKKWSALLPGSAFEYSFIDDALKRLYQNEIQLKKAAGLATVLALIIVFLGVIGLLSISIQKRTKEIGIRKVLGAGLPQLSYLFLKEFVPVLLVGGLVAIPVAWYLMSNWLNDYAYRIPLTLQPFLLSL